MGNISKVLRTLGSHPGYVLMRSLARISPLRDAVVAIQKSSRRPVTAYLQGLEGKRSPFFSGVDSEAFTDCLERDGYALGLELPSTAVDELLEFAQNNPCWADRNPALGFLPDELEDVRHKLGRRFLIAQYLNARRRSPLIGRLCEDPVLLEIAARYLGSAPKLVGVNMWWSYPVTSSTADRDYAAQMFHFDLDDFRFMKFFFYLTDVDESSGPHVIARGSHREKHHASVVDALRIRRYTDEEVVSAFGSDQIVSIMGPAGTGFAEDTLCVHKGDTPTERERLVLQLQYALNDYGVQHDDIDDSKLAMIG